MFRIIVTALLLAAIAWPAAADVTGPATVVDGDTIVIAGERVRLEGVDAPEAAPDLHRLRPAVAVRTYVDGLAAGALG